MRAFLDALIYLILMSLMISVIKFVSKPSLEEKKLYKTTLNSRSKNLDSKRNLGKTEDIKVRYKKGNLIFSGNFSYKKIRVEILGFPQNILSSKTYRERFFVKSPGERNLNKNMPQGNYHVNLALEGSVFYRMSFFKGRKTASFQDRLRKNIKMNSFFRQEEKRKILRVMKKFKKYVGSFRGSYWGLQSQKMWKEIHSKLSYEHKTSWLKDLDHGTEGVKYIDTYYLKFWLLFHLKREVFLTDITHFLELLKLKKNPSLKIFSKIFKDFNHFSQHVALENI